MNNKHNNKHLNKENKPELWKLVSQSENVSTLVYVTTAPFQFGWSIVGALTIK